MVDGWAGNSMPPKTLSAEDIAGAMAELHADWQYSSNTHAISREFKTRDFAEALLVTNLVAAVAERHNHHPDIKMGWGYCHIEFTTHSTQSLTELDIRCAKKLDGLHTFLISE